MKTIIQIAAFFACAVASAAQVQDTTPSFTNLSQAVSFIASCLDQDATNRFSSAFINPESGPQMHMFVFKSLKRTHQLRPLPTLYQGRDFEPNATTFVLGGHFKELGCVHIQFMRTNDVWKLHDSLICK